MLTSAALIKTYTSNGVKLALIRYADGGESVINFKHLPKFIKDDLKEKQTCKNCKGEGHLFVSDCCGSAPKSNGDCDTSDLGICPECGDHCEYGVNCEECDGTGEVI